MTFFSTVLSMGSEGGGSFALSDNQLSLLRVGIESILENLTRTFNHDLIPQIYELNGWDYDPRSSVQLSTKGIEEKDLEIFSKAVQRVVSVGAVDPTEDIEDTIREHIFELGPKSEANTKIRETAVNNSRSGDGLKEGMPNGTGSGTSDRDSSTDNTENA